MSVRGGERNYARARGPSAVADVTAEFTISADNQINNTGGTSTANMLVMVLVARDVTT